jgi:hypothetical protein
MRQTASFGYKQKGDLLGYCACLLSETSTPLSPQVTIRRYPLIMYGFKSETFEPRLYRGRYIARHTPVQIQPLQ